MQVQFGKFMLDTESRQLRHGDIERHLSPKAFELLRLLIECRPAAISKAQLHERLWPSTFVVGCHAHEPCRGIAQRARGIAAAVALSAHGPSVRLRVQGSRDRAGIAPHACRSPAVLDYLGIRAGRPRRGRTPAGSRSRCRRLARVSQRLPAPRADSR